MGRPKEKECTYKFDKNVRILTAWVFSMGLFLTQVFGEEQSVA